MTMNEWWLLIAFALLGSRSANGLMIGATMIRKFLMWLVWNVPLGRVAPWVFGLAIGRMPYRLEADNE